MENTQVQLAFCQFDVQLGNRKKNYEKVEELLKKTNADIIVLPELFTSGYHFSGQSEVDAAAEYAGKETAQFLLTLAKKKSCFIFAGFPEKTDSGVYNSSILAGYDGTEVYYRKAHLFGEEKKYFLPGNSPLEPVELHLKTGKTVRAGLMICFDWFFPETARTLALKGAQVLLHTANLVMPYCPDAMVTRCLENQVFSVTCNRIGKETCGDKTLVYIGRSRIINPKGVVLAEGGTDTEEIQTATIENVNIADNKNLNSHNHIFHERRTDLYRLS